MSIDPVDRRKLRETFQSLNSRTTDRGCTEAEAMAAAEKVSELLSKHGISSSDDLEFEELAITIGQRSVVDRLWSHVATFCHCKAWYCGQGRSWDFVYFGRWNDVIVAEYLHELLVRHMANAVKAFKATAEYKRRRSTKTRSEAVKAFKEGLARALGDKLWEIQWRRVPKVEGTNHTALVLSPLTPVEEALDRRNMQFSTKPLKPVKSAGKSFDSERISGHIAARNIDIHAGVGTSTIHIAGLLK